MVFCVSLLKRLLCTMIKTPQSFSVHFVYLNLNFPWNVCPKYEKGKRIPIPIPDKPIPKSLLNQLYICEKVNLRFHSTAQSELSLFWGFTQKWTVHFKIKFRLFNLILHIAVVTNQLYIFSDVSQKRISTY